MALILPDVPGVLKARLQWTYGTDASVYSHLFFHYTTAAPSAADLTTFANAITASYTADLKNLAPNTTYLTEVQCIDLSTRNTPPGVASVSIQGGAGSGPLAAETCALVNLHIGRRYRGGHPRLYLPFGTHDDLNAPQSWSSTFLTNLTTGFNAFISSLLGVGPPGPTCDHLANVSYYSNKVLRPVPVVDSVLSTSINRIPASQRRRMNR